MKWSLKHKNVSLILIIVANMYLDVWHIVTSVILFDSLATTIPYENCAEACSD